MTQDKDRERTCALDSIFHHDGTEHKCMQSMMTQYGQIIRLASTSPVNYAYFLLLNHNLKWRDDITSCHTTRNLILHYTQSVTSFLKEQKNSNMKGIVNVDDV